MKNDRRRPIRFKGFDWTELMQLNRITPYWPEVPNSFQKPTEYLSLSDAKEAYLIKEYLFGLTGCMPPEREKERKLACKYVRRFLTMLAQQEKKCGESHTLYEGMIKIKHDETLLLWVSRNLECLWT